ncbi:O-antigen ligase family protein [Acinetobacter junii]|uniref:O-antigen ligase family protein n=1 Tax=Acinetobacter junii TaxID=40215 RepID=UPI003215566E
MYKISLISGREFVVLISMVLVLLPLALPVGNIGDKPIDLTYSDLLLAISFIYFLFIGKFIASRNERKLLSISIFVFSFIVFLGGIGSILKEGDILPFLSSIRFAKHILFVFSAFLIYKLYRPSLDILITYTGYVSLWLVVVLFLSDVFFNPQFPSSRWGGVFLGFETYGFPNSIAVFYSFYICFILILLFSKKRMLIVPILLLILGIVFFTFSRSGWVTALIVLLPVMIYSSLKSKRLIFINISLLVFLVVCISFFFDKLFPIIEPWMYKVDTITGKDITVSGRDLIWNEAIKLIYDQPLMGYLFFPFSNYVSGYDTPHQQYLEILYKMGLVGFSLYFLYLFYLYLVFAKAGWSGNLLRKVVVTSVSLLTLGIMITNFGQPNFSFSLLSNAYIFFLSLYYFVFLGELN